MKHKINKLNSIKMVLGIMLIIFTSSAYSATTQILKSFIKNIELNLSHNDIRETKSTNQIQTTECYKIQLKSGWNIFSSPVLPDSADMKFIFQNLIDNGSLVKIQDEEGWSLEDIGIFGGWSNHIGNIVPTEGYKIKVDADDSIEFCGTLVSYPYPIPLNAGWNIIGYPRLDSVNALRVFEELITNGTLIKVQDEKGQSIENLGNYGGWQNFIGKLATGEGYKIKLNAPDTLWIYESYTDSISETPKDPGIGFKSVAINSQTKSAKEVNSFIENTKLKSFGTNHFKVVFQGNGLDHMNFYLVGFPSDLFDIGDEIAVFDEEICVGAISVTNQHLKNQIIPLTASSADLIGNSGFTEGNRYKFRIWKAETNNELDITCKFIAGEQFFTKYESALLSLEKNVSLDVGDNKKVEEVSIICFPNPFREQIIIQINLSKESLVDISVFNQSGQKVKSLAHNETISKGVYRLSWNGKEEDGPSISSGIYFLDGTINGKVYHKKILFQQ